MPATEFTPIPQVPDHELLRCIGTGSYGDVWLARSVTGRLHAVKVVSRSKFSDDRPFDREFQGLKKFEPVSRTHPGLVTVLHIGRATGGGSFFYVMELADDLRTGPEVDPDNYVPKTLSQLLRGGALPLDECIEIGLTLSDALSHLHRHELIHRDIKPANIIFVNGIARLADVGLVTSTGAEATYVGTEGYMPPEGPGKPSADLYALGKVLYEAAMGKSRTEFPELPTGLREREDAGRLMRFNDLLVKACADQPWQRFESADALHQSLLGLRRELGMGRTGHGNVRTRTGRRLHLVLPGADQQQLLQILNQRLTGAAISYSAGPDSAFTVDQARDLERSIAACDVLVLGLSDRSLQEEQTAYAAELASRPGRSRGDRPLQIIVVRVHLSVPLPLHYQLALRTAHFVDWTGPNDNDSLMTALTST